MKYSQRINFCVMVGISIEKRIKELVPKVQLLCVEVDVTVGKSSEKFWDVEVEKRLSEIRQTFKMADIATIPPNHETREAYKLCGKDPTRYRPSSEALLRRVISGKGLYHVNNVVDALNLISVVSGYSIGGFDMEKIKGKIRLDIGDTSGYDAIGRGELNIENMPALRDDLGFFGTPTSDSTRTMVRDSTTKFLMVFYDFLGDEVIDDTIELTADLLIKYAKSPNFFYTICK